MVKILIIYDSLSGNTEKMAFAVAEGARKMNDVEVEVKKVDTTSSEDLLKADAIVLGSPTYYGQMSGKLKTFIDTSAKIHGKLKGKVGGAFASSSGIASGAETTLLSIVKALLIHGMIIQGRHDGKHYGAAAVGAPDGKATEDCKELGNRIACLALRLRT
jgi:NAD(P)H dehydrogenase (quinone)